MKRVAKTLGAVMVLALALWDRGMANAGSSEGQRAYEQGLRFLEDEQPEAALDAFLRANSFEPSPVYEGQIGLANKALRRWLEAEAYLERALSQSTHPWIRRHRKILESELIEVESHIAELVLVGGTAGATVTIEDKEVGILPLHSPLRLPEGRVWVGFARSHVAKHVMLHLTRGETLTFRVPEIPDLQKKESNLAPAVGAPQLPAEQKLERLPFFYRTSPWVMLLGGLSTVAAGSAHVALPQTDRGSWETIGAGLVGAGLVGVLAAEVGGLLKSEYQNRALVKYLSAGTNLLLGVSLAASSFQFLRSSGYGNDAALVTGYYGGMAVSTLALVWSLGVLLEPLPAAGSPVWVAFASPSGVGLGGAF